jgi:hypothetical protein
LFLVVASGAHAVAPGLVPYQGTLKSADGSPLPDGAYQLRFSLWNLPQDTRVHTNEPHTFNGATITLRNIPVQSASETMRKADGTITYNRGGAYTINNTTGVITRTSATAIPNGTQVVVTYTSLASSIWEETQTVQVANGLFSTNLGSVSPLLPAALTGEEWLSVEVRHGSTWQRLEPRMRLASSPYALRVGTISGAQGGSITGRVDVSGPISGAGEITSVGSTFFSTPGVIGTGVAQGPVFAAGVHGVSASAETPAIVSEGNLLVISPGRIQAIGALRPDYSTGWRTLISGGSSTSISIPAVIGQSIENVIFEVQERIPITGGGWRYQAVPINLNANIRVGVPGSNDFLVVTRNSGATGELYYRVRVWIMG